MTDTQQSDPGAQDYTRRQRPTKTQPGEGEQNSMNRETDIEDFRDEMGVLS